MIRESLGIVHSLIREHKRAVVTMSCVFLAGVIIGFILPASLKLILFRTMTKKFADIVSDNALLGCLKIFLSNSLAGLVTIVLGFSVILPALALLFNGFLIGIMIDLFLKIAGLTSVTPFLLVASILPHGIIELPTIIICAVFGVLLGLKLFLGKQIMPEESLWTLIKKTSKAYLFVIVPLLFCAGLIESFVTPIIADSNSMLTAEGDTDQKLDKLILDENDVAGLELTLRELSIEEYYEKVPMSKTMKYANLIAVLFYDEEIYQEFQKRKNNPTGSKIYVSESPDIVLTVRITRFNSSEEAKKALVLDDKMFELSVKEMEGKVVDIGNQTSKIVYESKTIYMKSDRVESLVYSITFEGHDIELFNNLVELQLSKLMDAIPIS